MSSATQDNKITLQVIDPGDGGKPIAVFPEAKVYSTNPTKMATGGSRAPMPRELNQGYAWAPWGAKDMLPTKMRCGIREVPIASAAMQKKIELMHGNGLIYYKNSDLAGGNIKVKRHYDPVVEMWAQKCRLHTRWWPAVCADYSNYLLCFSELVKNRAGNMISGIFHKPAEHCRLEQMDKRSHQVERIYYSPDFGSSYSTPTQFQPDRMRKLPLLPWYDEERWIEKFRGNSFAYYSYFTTPGMIYYPEVFWAGLFQKGGWLEVAKNVSRIITAMQNNQIKIVYLIHIPDTYFRHRYGAAWDGFDEKERTKKIDELIDSINEKLGGIEDSYKSITSMVLQDPMTGTVWGKIEIEAIEDKVKEGAWVPSANESNAQISFAMNIHPGTMGLASHGGNGGAGSGGSDQREAFNSAITMNTMHQLIALEALNFAMRYNGWDITWAVDHTYHTTTNNQESGIQESENTLKVGQ